MTLAAGRASLLAGLLHLSAQRWWLAAGFLLVGLVQIVSALRLLRHRVEVSDGGLVIAADDQTRSVAWTEVERLVGRKRPDGRRHLALHLYDGVEVNLPVLGDRDDGVVIGHFRARHAQHAAPGEAAE